MNCREAREALNQFVDDELESGRSFEVDKHLELCARCRAEVEEIRALDARVRDVCRGGAGAACPAELRGRLKGALDGEISAGSRRARIGRGFRRAAAAAATLLIAAVLFLGFSAGPVSASFA